MPRRRFAKKQTMGKLGVKHAGTLLANIGSGSAPTEFIVIETEGGLRQETTATIQDSSSTDEVCRIGDLIKFVNFHIETSPRMPANDEHVGWVEYAVVWKKESDTPPSITNLGTLTLGTVCTNLFRNDCLWTGFIPIGKEQSNGAQLSIKIPRTRQFLKMGDELVLYVYFRSQLSTSTGTNDNRVVLSHNYKCYS